MKQLLLAGGHPAPPGTYREMHSGQVVHLHGHNVLPGSPNSDAYVCIGEPDEHNAAEFRRPAVRSEQA